MTDSLWSLTLAGFLDRTASASPAPGGGSVAAACATLGLGLVVMGLEVTRKRASAEETAALDPLLRSGRELLERLKAHADRDIAVFAEHMAARSLPKGTDEEKDFRRRRMQDTLAAATESPLAAARDIDASLDLAAQTVDRCKPVVLSDVAAGVDLLAGSLTAVLRTVDINLQDLSDILVRERFREESTALAASAAKLLAVAIATVEARMTQ
jgi:formiminotetrahydrofolate cyclodeaminase